MNTHRTMSTVAVLAAVLYLAGTSLPATALGAGPTKTVANKGKVIKPNVHRNSKARAHAFRTKARPAQPAAPASSTICYTGAPGTTCYYGCIPYYKAPSAGWNAPATSGAGSGAYNRTAQSQLGTVSTGTIPPAGATLPRAQQQSAGTMSTVCYNVWTPSGGRPGYTWYVPATSGRPAAQPPPVFAPALVCSPTTRSEPSAATTAWYNGLTQWISRPYYVVSGWLGCY